MMTTSLLKADSFLLSHRTQSFHGYRYRVKSFQFIENSKLTCVKSFMNPTASSINISNTSASSSKGAFLENETINTVAKTVKWLKIPAIVMIQSLLLLLMMMMTTSGHRRPELACLSFPSSSAGQHTSSDRRKQNGKVYHVVAKECTCSCQCSSGGKEDMNALELLLSVLAIPVAIMMNAVNKRHREPPIDVFKLQVGLLVPGLSFTRNLNRIIDTPNATVSYQVNEITESLLKHFMYWHAVDSSVKVLDYQEAKKYFNLLTDEEHWKTEKRAHFSQNHLKKGSMKGEGDNQLKHTHVVVRSKPKTTITNANRILSFLPENNSSEEVLTLDDIDYLPVTNCFTLSNASSQESLRLNADARCGWITEDDVTFVFAAKAGSIDFPTTISDMEALEKALKQLQSIPNSSYKKQLSILWNPVDDEMLSVGGTSE